MKKELKPIDLLKQSGKGDPILPAFPPADAPIDFGLEGLSLHFLSGRIPSIAPGKRKLVLWIVQRKSLHPTLQKWCLVSQASQSFNTLVLRFGTWVSTRGAITSYFICIDKFFSSV